MHIRDARNLFHTMQSLKESERPDLLARACILFAAAGLEANLSYFSVLAIAVNETAPQPLFRDPEVEYLKAVQSDFSKNGELRERKQKQELADRIRIVPALSWEEHSIAPSTLIRILARLSVCRTQSLDETR